MSFFLGLRLPGLKVLFFSRQFVSTPWPHVRGTAMAEYILPTALLVAGVLAVSAGLSNNILVGLSKALGGTQASTRLHLKAFGSVAPGEVIATAPSPPSNPPAPLVQMASGAGLSAVPGSNRTGPVVLPSSPYPAASSLATVVETVGASGATNQMSNYLMQLATSLRDQGRLNTAQYSALSNLSNQSFKLGHLQKSLEDYLDQVPQLYPIGPTTDMALWRAQVYTTRHVAIPISATPVSLQELSVFLSNNSRALQLRNAQEFVSLFTTNPEIFRSSIYSFATPVYDAFRSAHQSGALADPLVLNVVYDLFTKIVGTSDLASSYLQDIMGEHPGVISTSYGIAERPPDTLVDRSYRNRVFQNYFHQYDRSSNICTVGSGTVTQLVCQ
jgi:hypothetical protein